jgi:hypothetical protein
MPTLHGWVPDAGTAPEHPCIWCGRKTDIIFVPEFRPELGPQSMHMLCAAGMMRAYLRWKAGHVLPSRDSQRLARLAGLRPALPEPQDDRVSGPTGAALPIGVDEV